MASPAWAQEGFLEEEVSKPGLAEPRSQQWGCREDPHRGPGLGPHPSSTPLIWWTFPPICPWKEIL